MLRSVRSRPQPHAAKCGDHMFTEDNRQDAECRGRISASARKASKNAPKPSVCSDGCQAVRITPLDAHAKRGPTGDRNRREAGRPNDAENGSETADVSGSSLLSSYMEVKSGSPSPDSEASAISKVLPDMEKAAVRKRSTLKVVGEVSKFETDRAAKLARCGGHIQMEYWCDHDRTTVKSANWCNMPRLCQACAHARGIKLAKASAEKVATALNEDRDLRPWLVTFTVKNGSDLAERLEHLLDGYSAGVQRAKDASKGKRRHSQFGHVQGAIISVEIKRGKAGGWHPHVHCLWLVPASAWAWHEGKTGVELEPNAHRELCNEWHEITGDSYVVNAKPLETAQDMAKGEPVQNEYLVAELFEVFKYLTKPGETSPKDVVHAWWVTVGKRLVRSYGKLRGLKVPEDLNDEPLTGDSFEIWFRWKQGRYQRTSVKFITRKESDHVEAETVGETLLASPSANGVPDVWVRAIVARSKASQDSRGDGPTDFRRSQRHTQVLHGTNNSEIP